MKVILAFVFPTTVLFSWYMKNLIIFGFFGASSWAGFNLSFTTVNRLNSSEKEILVIEEKLSPLVLLPIYSGIESYHDHLDLNEKTTIAVLDEKGKGTEGWKNYNHKGFIKLSALRMKDNLTCMQLFPLEYCKTVILGVIQFFGPTTRWHPHDQLRSPHIPLRKKIEEWENFHNSILHSLPLKRVGFYLFFLMIFGVILFGYIVDIFKWKTFNLKEKMIAFCTLNIFYVTGLSCLVTFGELSRYRFMIEPLIWIMVLVFCIDNFKKIKVVCKVDKF
ncbi:MAG: hypothetical protein JXR03_19720 [Cyclobacteriaceae bacterium]